MYFGLEDNFDKLFHSGDVGDDSQCFTADFFIVDLYYKVDQHIDQLALDQFVLGIGHEQLPVVKKHISQTT